MNAYRSSIFFPCGELCSWVDCQECVHAEYVTYYPKNAKSRRGFEAQFPTQDYLHNATTYYCRKFDCHAPLGGCVVGTEC